jgi:hypothetical protein
LQTKEQSSERIKSLEQKRDSMYHQIEELKQLNSELTFQLEREERNRINKIQEITAEKDFLGEQVIYYFTFFELLNKYR